MGWDIPTIDKHVGSIGATIIGGIILTFLFACIAVIPILITLNTTFGPEEAVDVTLYGVLGTLTFVALSWLIGEVIVTFVDQR